MVDAAVQWNAQDGSVTIRAAGCGVETAGGTQEMPAHGSPTKESGSTMASSGCMTCFAVLGQWSSQDKQQEKQRCAAKQVHRATGACQWQLVGAGTQQAMTWAEVLEGLRDDHDV